ncbi:MAG: hypothetical protein LCH37_14885 [Bacteroidetes bacterium]|nr:hypothetical protein [Bacteroidota bacterium]
MSLVIEITEERLQQLLIGAAEQGVERAFKKLNRELKFEHAKWLTKEQVTELLCISDKMLRILVTIGAVKTNDYGSGKVIHYEKESVLSYLENPSRWDKAKKLFRNSKNM